MYTTSGKRKIVKVIPSRQSTCKTALKMSQRYDIFLACLCSTSSSIFSSCTWASYLDFLCTTTICPSLFVILDSLLKWKSSFLEGLIDSDLSLPVWSPEGEEAWRRKFWENREAWRCALVKFADDETYRFLPIFTGEGLEKWFGLMKPDKLLSSLLLNSCSNEVVSPAMLAFAINDVNLDLSPAAISSDVSITSYNSLL